MARPANFPFEYNWSKPSVQSPTLDKLPRPPEGKVGWPWTEGGLQLPVTTPEGYPWPLISIITPSFNQAQYIETTIRSVLLQGYPRVEYIVIDGGSTDGTIDIIRKYEPWLAYWVSEHDEGQAHAIIKGFERAKADIFAWLNSDDQYLREAFHSAARVFLERPDLDLLYGDCEMIDAEGRRIDYIEGRTGDLMDLLAQDFIPQPSAFFRRRAWETVGGLDVSLRFILDFDLWIRMMLDGIQSLYVPVPFSRFRWHGVSKSNRDVVEFGYEYLGLLDGLFEGSHDPGLQRARLKGYHHAFSIIASGHERRINDREYLEDDVLKALALWEKHLERNESAYMKAPDLWAHGLSRIGQSYCLHGHMSKGRQAFTAALRADKGAHRPLFGWIFASLGFRPYRWFTSAWRTLFNLTHHLRRRFHGKG